MKYSDDYDVCRCCGLVLRSHSHLNIAFHPETGKRVPHNFYGGFVCSYDCDKKASLEQESSFPNAGKCHLLSGTAFKMADAMIAHEKAGNDEVK